MGEPPLNDAVYVAVPEVQTDWSEGSLLTVGEEQEAGTVRLHGGARVLRPLAWL